MSDEPTYPKAAAVGAEAARDATDDISDGKLDGGAKRKNYVRTGVAVGIGSAAIVAALLYANRGKRSAD